MNFDGDEKIVGKVTYSQLHYEPILYLVEPLSAFEINNLKYIRQDKKIFFIYDDYNNVLQVMKECINISKNITFEIILKDKNVFNKFLFDNYDELELLKDKIVINVNGESLYLQEYYSYEKKLFDMIEPALNLSTLEKYLFAYNIVKKYKLYNNDIENYCNGVHLYKILDNEYIVCAGFVNLLCDLLKKLDIECKKYDVVVDIGLDKLENTSLVMPEYDAENKKFFLKKVNHSRCIVNLVDDKYGIDGYYIVDPTWDNNLDNDSYVFSLMTHNEVEGIFRYNFLEWRFAYELFFINSLEEFYKKINIMMKKLKCDEKIVISYILSFITDLDNQYYNEMINKHSFLLDLSYLLKREEIENILLELGEYILQKVNNFIDGEVISLVLKELYLLDEEKLKTIILYNKKLYDYYFPKRYKVDKDDNKELVLNIKRKF